MSNARTPTELLDRLVDADRFRGIWCKVTWISDALELRRDHVALRALMHRVSAARCTEELEAPLHTAMDLFRVHAEIEQKLLPEPVATSSIDHALLMFEQLEGTDPDDPLHIVQAAHLALQIDALVQRESDMLDDLGERRSADLLEDDLLCCRADLLREAGQLLGGYTRRDPATPWPS